MEIEEWLFRIVGAIIILNIFSYGIYVILRGYYKFKRLERMNKVKGHLIFPLRKWNPSVQWYWQGQTFLSTNYKIYVLNERELINLYVSDAGVNSQLNIWTHNGKGQMIAGSFICTFALFLMIVLI